MSLIICPEVSLRSIESAIVSATHGLTDTNGERVLINTIDSRTLKSAALLALQIATGHVLWPGDEVLRIKSPKPVQGGVVVE